MKKWIPTIVTVLVTIVGALTPQIREAVKDNATLSIVLGGIYAIVKGLIDSPIAKS